MEKYIDTMIRLLYLLLVIDTRISTVSTYTVCGRAIRLMFWNLTNTDVIQCLDEFEYRLTDQGCPPIQICYRPFEYKWEINHKGRYVRAMPRYVKTCRQHVCTCPAIREALGGQARIEKPGVSAMTNYLELSEETDE